MTKIVYNACFGGFSLSHRAIMRYAERKNLILYTSSDAYSQFKLYYTDPDKNDDNYFSDRNIPRDDPDLAVVVEELGAEANGLCADLAIRELPAGTKYRITEYDGNESVDTPDDYEWNIA